MLDRRRNAELRGVFGSFQTAFYTKDISFRAELVVEHVKGMEVEINDSENLLTGVPVKIHRRVARRLVAATADFVE